MNRLRAQAARFARLFAVAVVAQIPALEATHKPLTWSLVGAALVGAVETAWRQLKPPPDAPAYSARH